MLSTSWPFSLKITNYKRFCFTSKQLIQKKNIQSVPFCFVFILQFVTSWLSLPGTAWFSAHSNIIQLLDKYSSRGSNGSVQGQLQTRKTAMPSISRSLSLSPLVYHCIRPPLPAFSSLLLSPPASSLSCFFSVCSGQLMSAPASPCFHSFPDNSLALMDTKGRMPVLVTCFLQWLCCSFPDPKIE